MADTDARPRATDTIGVCLPREEGEAFRLLAEREDIKPSQLGRRIIRQWLRAQRPEVTPP